MQGSNLRPSGCKPDALANWANRPTAKDYTEKYIKYKKLFRLLNQGAQEKLPSAVWTVCIVSGDIANAFLIYFTSRQL